MLSSPSINLLTINQMKKKIYQIFITNVAECVLFANLDNDVQAAELALALHKTSNVPHSVTVYEGDKDSGVKILDLYTLPKDAEQ